jgi:hypothetical protein
MFFLEKNQELLRRAGGYSKQRLLYDKGFLLQFVKKEFFLLFTSPTADTRRRRPRRSIRHARATQCRRATRRGGQHHG